VAHEVFVSYSHHDKPQADAVCATLEAKGIRCWIAPRDVIPGQEWGAAIVDAIQSSRVMVLVFSSHANASPQIRREVQIAVSAERVLIPFRIEDVAPAQSLKYFLGTPHWLDALTIPLEAHLERLATAVTSFLAVGEPVGSTASTATTPQSGFGTETDLTPTPSTPGAEPTTDKRPPAADGTEAEASARDRAPTLREDSREAATNTPHSTDIASPGGRFDAPTLGSPTTTDDSQTASVSPMHFTPTLARAPRFRRLNRRSQVVLGALTVVVAAVVAYLLWPSPSSRQIVLLTGLGNPHGVAVDSAGGVYVADHDHNRVLKLAAGSTSPTRLPFAGLGWPSGVAVDSVGTVYVTDSDNSRVLKLAAGSNTAVTLPFTGPLALLHPRGVAVDSVGSVYVADHDNHRVLKLAAGSTGPTPLPFTGLNGPAGVAVDSAGSVYVTDEDTIRVYEMYNLGGLNHQTDVPFTGLSGPHAVAVDTFGNVYVTDASNRVLKLAAGTTTELPFTGLDNPGGVAVDSGGSVYVADWGHGRVLKLQPG
jgi:DNA-binding beta-propeller fold protein YncE